MLISFVRTRSQPAEQPEILADGSVLLLTGFYRPEQRSATGTGQLFDVDKPRHLCGAVGRYFCSFVRFC